MDTLNHYLQHRTWRELRLTAHAHGLPFNTHHSKQQACERLARQLEAGQLRKSMRALGQSERAALTALQAAGGTLPLHRFTAAYGAIRPYRPWREDAPQHPWRRPVSPAERLWFLGLVAIRPGAPGRPRQVAVPVEVLAMLPPLPCPRANLRRLPHPPASPDQVLTDVAALLGTLFGQPVKPRWHRWLPPHALKRINAGLRVPEPIDGVRSELQTDRLRFVHYLAEIAGLVTVRDSRITLTPAAWLWLDLAPAEQWRWLWDAVSQDLEGRQPLWHVFRFTPISSLVWKSLIHQLSKLVPDRTYTIRSLLEALKPYLLDDLTLVAVKDVLRGPLTWSGIVTVQRDHVTVTAAGAAALTRCDGAFSAPGNALLNIEEEAVWVKPSAMPRTRPFAELSAWAVPDGDRWRIDADTVSRAVAQGYEATDIARTVGALCGQPLPLTVYERINEWIEKANHLVLRQTIVLTSPDADLLADLRQDTRLRSMFLETLAPHHLAVVPHAAGALRQALEGRGHAVTTLAGCASVVDTPLGALDYAWLAVRVYRSLSAYVELPVRIPATVQNDLSAQLSAGQTDMLERSAEIIRDSLARAIDGYTELPPPVIQDDPTGIRAALRTAFEQRTSLTIEYFSPGYGAVTIRTITPILPIVETGGAEYIDAWCETAGAARTFRLDRILRVVDER